MNALNMARTAYSSVAGPVRTNQGAEYDAFSQITGKIKTASQKGASGYPELVSALHENQRLWLILATDVANPDNQLPDLLRAQVLYLAEFVQVQSGRILRDSASVDALIDVNLAVMRGLRDQGAST